MKTPIDKSRRIPVYKQCTQAIRKAIHSGQYAVDEFLPPERELSEALGVNRITLRRGLAELTRLGLLQSIAGSGHLVVNRTAMPAKTGLIGCIMLRRGGSLTKSPFYAEVFENIEAEVTRSGYNVVYSSMTDDELWHGPGQPVAQPRLIDLPIRGVVLVGGLTDELATAYLHRGVRVLLLDKLLLHALISSIIPDNTGGMAAATRYLVELGHRRFVFVGAPDDPVVSARREGIVKSLQDASIPADRLLTLAAGYAAEPACEAVGRLLDSLAGGNRPTAFLCINDESAIGTLRALKARGFHVPGDVSVTGFDDIAASAQTEPPLTTVRVDKKEMGRLAARLLIDQIEAEQASSVKLILQTELVVRSSSARPKTEEQASPPHADAVRPDVPESRLVR